MLQWFRDLKLSVRILAMTVAILLTVVAVNYALVAVKYQASAQQAMVEKAAAFTAVADAAKNHTSVMAAEGAFDREALRAELEADIAAGKSYTETKVFNTIPVVAGWKAAEEAASKEGIEFRVTAFEARNPENQPDPGTFEYEIFADLESGFAAEGQEAIYRIDEATNQLHYLRAIRLTRDCMTCHGDPATSKTGDGKVPLGFTMENWKVGDMHGAFHVVMPMAPVDEQVAGFIGSGMLFTVPMAIGAALLIYFVLRYSLALPIAGLVRGFTRIADGDLTQRVDVRSKDEIGVLGSTFNAFAERLQELIGNVRRASTEVAASATEIAASSDEIAVGVKDQSSQVERISAAVEEVSASATEVAEKSVDAARNAEASGSAAAKGGEVVDQSIEQMIQISEAVSTSARSVASLGERSQQIGEVVNVINDIADQTNLLALNAAIEAARAGEHGRGFAVVADEVRKLADRTTKATEEIAQSIAAIQSETGEAVARMNQGTEQVEAGSQTVSQAGDSLRTIVSSAKEVAMMIQSIAAAAEQQSSASREVSQNIDGIAAVCQQTSEGTSQPAEAATQLSTRSEQLLELVSRFKIE